MEDVCRTALESLYSQSMQEAADFDLLAYSTVEITAAAGRVRLVPMRQILEELFALEPENARPVMAEAA